MSQTMYVSNAPLVQYSFVSFFSPGSQIFAQSALNGALPQLYAATSPAAVAGSYYGPAFRDLWGGAALALVSAAGSDSAAAKELWEYTERATGYTFAFD